MSETARPLGPSVAPPPTSEVWHPALRPKRWAWLRTSKGAVVLAVLLLLAGGFLAGAAQTNGGSIRISQVSFPTSTGGMMTGLLYAPVTATVKTPAPGVVAIHGYINSADTMDGFSIELARRGVVVLDANQTGHGGSVGPAFLDGFGGPDALAYMSTLPIVRHGDIGLVGHSMGGWASVIAAGTMPNGYRSVVLVSSSTSTPPYEPIPGTPTFPKNLAVIEATNSEFSQLMWAVPKGNDIPKSPRLQTLFGTSSPVVPGQVYGSVAQGNARVLYMDNAIHPGLTFDSQAVSQTVGWFQRTLPGVGMRAGGDQIWLWNEVGTFIGLLGVLMLLFGVGGMLLRTRFFSSVARPMPDNRSLHGMSWWAGAALLVLTGVGTFFWFQTWGANQFKAGGIFPENITTGIVTWAVGDAVIGALLFGAWHLLMNRRPKHLAVVPSAADGPARMDLRSSAVAIDPPGMQQKAFAAYGVAEPEGRFLDLRNIGKSLLLAGAAVGALYAGVFFFHWVWSSDVRIWVFNIKPVSTMYLPVVLSYIGPFFVYFLVVSTVLFGQLRPRTQSMAKFMGIVMSVLTVGFVGLIGLEYGVLWATGELATSSQPLLAIVAFQFVPVFLIVGAVLAYFFWKTGRIWTGVFACSLLVTTMIVTAQALQGVPW